MIVPGSMVTVITGPHLIGVWSTWMRDARVSKNLGCLMPGHAYLVLAVVRSEVVILFEERVGWCLLQQVRETTT